jgi:integrase
MGDVGDNPASRVHLFNADNKVEHYLDDAELERLLRVLKEDSPRHRSVRLIALFLLSTGARLNEALRARWQDIDRSNRAWRIPALNSKSNPNGARTGAVVKRGMGYGSIIRDGYPPPA